MRSELVEWNKHLRKIIDGEVTMCECDNGCGEKFLYGDNVYKVRKMTFVCEDCIVGYLEDGEDAEEYLHTLDDDDIEEPDWDSILYDR